MSNAKIKKYNDFMPNTSKFRFSKILNQLVVSGETKRKLFSKSKEFELQIYYTPLKGKIIEIRSYNTDISKLNLPFKIGDNIEIAKKWCIENGHKIVHDINRAE